MNRLILVALASIISSPLLPAADTIVPAADGMTGKVFAGYQGWYRTPADGSGLGWEHYESYNLLDVDPSVKVTAGWEDYDIHGEGFLPGLCGIDFWPDMSEMDEDEKFATPFDHADGSTAYVFSSQHPKTVDRHFKWMKDYGIDGIFLQRFAHDVLEGGHHQWKLLQPANNRMAAYVQKGAQAHGRAYSIMYDLSGIRHGEMGMVMDDWRQLCDQLDLLNDPNYLHEKGKPMVAIWGVGFASGNRKYTLDEVSQFIDFLKNDPKYGGCTVLLGVPTYWRTLQRDAVSDPKFHDVIRSADAILPWTVGRFGGSATALERGKTYVQKDQEWCDENGVHYLPLAFPGFSWANRYAFKDAKFNHIPREGGKFLWSQAIAAKRAGADTIYLAMFDEMDEGTQIFKVSNNPPVGESKFLTYEPHAPDYYLRLSGAIGKMLRGEIPVTEALPVSF
ncbi:MAG: glycoside hydrolase family 71/99-like protein [Opitutales bacterium]